MMKFHANNSLSACAVLFACAWSVLHGAAAAQPRRHHGAPWDSSVAWSRTIHAGGSAIRLDVAPGPLDATHAQVVDWVETAAHAVSEYYGHFPVPRMRVLVVPVAGRRGVLTGTTWGSVDGFPAFTRMRLGEDTTAEDLTGDWTMTHEFVHTALPSLAENHHWLEEGLATYVEPIARAQIGTLTPEYVWQETVEGMPKGEPRPGGQGLDQTQTWASTYWGGALFCMMADIQIREATSDRKGLQDALRGILTAGGSIAVSWSVSRVMATGDRATGTTVLTDLYRKMGEHAFAPIDLDALWKQLGIHMLGATVTFDNQAPLAAVRNAITSSRSSSNGAVSRLPAHHAQTAASH
jgi:hypothetical protein